MAPTRQCPTRVNGGDPLIAHSISLPTCRKRQREHYHKCFSCAHAGAGEQLKRPELAKLPTEPRPAPIETAGATSEGAA